MSTDLTREQACDKFIAQKMRDGAGGLNRIISRAAFEAGWSARDAELARLAAENAALRAACEAALGDVSLVNRTDGLHLASYDILTAALAHKEPSDA